MKDSLQKWIGLFLSILFISIFISSHGNCQTVQLPRTGQDSCYDWQSPWQKIDCSGPGEDQDGAFHMGYPWPTPRFIVQGDCVIDNLTSAMWPRNGNLPGGTRTWNQAIDYANSLALCGYTDWRIPNIVTLETLFNAGVTSPGAWLNAQGFQNVQTGKCYWSSTTVANQTDNAWLIGSAQGDVDFDVKSGNYCYALPARPSGLSVPSLPWRTGQTEVYRDGDDGTYQAGVPWPGTRFTVSQDGHCVTDNLTSLTWAQDANLNGSSTWAQALDFFSGFELCGHSDWRLPNRKELFTLVDRSQYYPALPPGHPFSNVQTHGYWSSSTEAAQAGATAGSTAWALILEYGHLDYVAKNGNDGLYAVWPVRGGISRGNLVVSKSGTGSISSVPSAIDCGTSCTIQSASFVLGTVVTLTAQPQATFTSWEGCASTDGASCTVVMNKDVSVTATFTYRPAPVLSAISPATGTIGTVVTIKGKYFGPTKGSSTVTFHETPVISYTSWTDTAIKCVVPSGAATGAVVVTTPAGASTGKTFTVNPPLLSAISPATGTIGTVVTIKGKYFGPTKGSSTVTFHETPVISYTSWTDTAIKCVVPSGAATGAVVVTTPAGASTGKTFTVNPPLLSAISPATGTIGTVVTIKGKYFGPTKGSSTVTFHETPVISYTSWTDTAIKCVVPSGAATGAVVVTTPAGASTGKTFTVNPPLLSAISPATGTIGTVVTIKGKYFGPTKGSSTVTFHETPVISYTSWTDTAIKCVVPSGAATGAVVVTTPAGASTGKTFTVKP